MKKKILILIALIFSLYTYSQKKDSLSGQEKFKDLPLESGRLIKFNTTEGTWLSLDISPDGKTIMFDMLGDLYTIPFLEEQLPVLQTDWP